MLEKKLRIRRQKKFDYENLRYEQIETCLLDIVGIIELLEKIEQRLRAEQI